MSSIPMLIAIFYHDREIRNRRGKSIKIHARILNPARESTTFYLKAYLTYYSSWVVLYFCFSSFGLPKFRCGVIYVKYLMPVANFSLIISRSVRDPSTYHSLPVLIVKSSDSRPRKYIIPIEI